MYALNTEYIIAPSLVADSYSPLMAESYFPLMADPYSPLQQSSTIKNAHNKHAILLFYFCEPWDP